MVDGSIDTFGETNVQLDKNFNLNDSTAFRVNLFLENLENHRDFYYGDAGINLVLKYDLGDGSTLDLSYGISPKSVLSIVVFQLVLTTNLLNL